MTNHRKFSLTNNEHFFLKNFKFKNLLQFTNNKNDKVTTSRNNKIITKIFNGESESERKGFSMYNDPDLDTEDTKARILHSMTKKVWGGNFSSPIENKLIKGARVLDIWYVETRKKKPEFYI